MKDVRTPRELPVLRMRKGVLLSLAFSGLGLLALALTVYPALPWWAYISASVGGLLWKRLLLWSRRQRHVFLAVIGPATPTFTLIGTWYFLNKDVSQDFLAAFLSILGIMIFVLASSLYLERRRVEK